MTTDPSPGLPPGATPIEVADLLAIIGELYVQTWHLRRTLAAAASAPRVGNGSLQKSSFESAGLDGAVQREP